MAVVTGTVQSASNFTKPMGFTPTHTISSVEYELESCIVHVTFPSGTYAQADGLTFSPATVIQNSKRDGKTVVPIACSAVGAGDENGALTFAGDFTVSAGACHAHLLKEDLTTEHDNAAMSAVWNRPLAFCVTYYQPVEG